METDLVPIVISFMDQLFDQVFAIADDPRLVEWGNNFIEKLVGRTEDQIQAQLGQ